MKPFVLFNREPASFGDCLTRLLAHIRPRRSQMERRSGYGTYQSAGLDHIAPMPGAVPMNKWRAR